MADNTDTVNQPSEPQETPEAHISEEDLSETELENITGGFKPGQNITEKYNSKTVIKGNNFQPNKAENQGIIME